MREKAEFSCLARKNATYAKEKAEITHAAITGAEYGFEQGYNSATEQLRAAIGALADESARILVMKLVEGLQWFSRDAHASFMESLEVSAVKTKPVNCIKQ